MNEENNLAQPQSQPETKPQVKSEPAKITYDDFAKVEIRAGKILSAEKIADADKLLKLMVDFAESAPRQIVSGISAYFPDPAVLVGRTCMFVTNLASRTIRGHESNGMLFAISTPDQVDGTKGVFSLLEPSPAADGRVIAPGTLAK